MDGGGIRPENSLASLRKFFTPVKMLPPDRHLI